MELSLVDIKPPADAEHKPGAEAPTLQLAAELEDEELIRRQRRGA